MLILIAILWTFASPAVSAQTLEVVPDQSMVDQVPAILASGLQPGERVLIQGQLTDGDGATWKSEAEFIADARGVVDTSKQAPAKGSYHDVCAMGLVLFMKPAGGHVAMYRAPRGFSPQIIQFHLMRNGKLAASAQLEQRTIADGVHQIKVEGTLKGILFLPSASKPVPAVLVVGGSEGGVPVEKAAWLASHGYAALALAYFRYEDLPRELAAIPLEYFGTAVSWMMQQPQIEPDRIAVMGTSRGGELALQLGSMYPEIKAVVAYVPADVRYPACCGGTMTPYAWTWRGLPLSFVPLRSVMDPVARTEAAIRVEDTHGPILLISGQDDGVWMSSMMANDIVARLAKAHFPYSVVHLDYPHAGHTVGRPEIVPAWHGTVMQPVSGRAMDLGGNAKGDADSSLDAIPKVLDFLTRSLQQPASTPSSSPGRPQ